jgi:hypothetical protein
MNRPAVMVLAILATGSANAKEVHLDMLGNWEFFQTVDEISDRKSFGAVIPLFDTDQPIKNHGFLVIGCQDDPAENP